MGLASASILGFESRINHYHISLSEIRNPSSWEAKSPHLCPPETGGANFTARPFSSPPTSRWDTVELFETNSMGTVNLQSQSYLTTDGQLASLSWYQATIWDLQRIFLLLPR
jgi:hypothetical protein